MCEDSSGETANSLNPSPEAFISHAPRPNDDRGAKKKLKTSIGTRRQKRSVSTSAASCVFRIPSDSAHFLPTELFSESILHSELPQSGGIHGNAWRHKLRVLAEEISRGTAAAAAPSELFPLLALPPHLPSPFSASELLLFSVWK
ncbi:unnamed protein product [Caenorhabditis auriculariae]|uniref:Uncharacterized protein n=1 Tax=Caenorhabditis auriculariae TaxID=2777116 RepID=A0A8S1GVE0_9PELO|nr:unnamed protein product [Caenorhabditis auriculariae]